MVSTNSSLTFILLTQTRADCYAALQVRARSSGRPEAGRQRSCAKAGAAGRADSCARVWHRVSRETHVPGLLACSGPGCMLRLASHSALRCVPGGRVLQVVFCTALQSSELCT
jgi:hypothetical protein